MTILRRLLTRAVARLPRGVQYELRRLNFARQIRRGNFLSQEPEVADVTHHVRSGDWVIDVGANVGHYTCHMARCAGSSGRVLAFEPVPTSFALLAANVRAAGVTNVTLFNVALSSSPALLGMTVPSQGHTELSNYYQAHISSQGAVQVLCLTLDSISIPGTVRLVKIDAEGHDLQVLMGMQSLLKRDRPVLIVEGSPGSPLAAWLRERGYVLRQRSGSPNIVAQPSQYEAAESGNVDASAVSEN